MLWKRNRIVHKIFAFFFLNLQIQSHTKICTDTQKRVDSNIPFIFIFFSFFFCRFNLICVRYYIVRNMKLVQIITKVTYYVFHIETCNRELKQQQQQQHQRTHTTILYCSSVQCAIFYFIRFVRLGELPAVEM